MKKILCFLIITLLCISNTLVYANKKVRVVCYDTENNTFQSGKCDLRLHRPIGIKNIEYIVLDEQTFNTDNKKFSKEMERKLKDLYSATQTVLDSGKGYNEKKIDNSRYGRIDSNAWNFDLTISPLVAPVLKEKGIDSSKQMWLCVGDRKGNITKIYLQLEK